MAQCGVDSVHLLHLGPLLGTRRAGLVVLARPAFGGACATVRLRHDGVAERLQPLELVVELVLLGQLVVLEPLRRLRDGVQDLASAQPRSTQSGST